jgi:histidine ammonia-lyase
MIKVGNRRLEAGDFERFLYGGEQVTLDTAARDKVLTNFNFLQQYSKEKIIYGINTGLGPMAQYKIKEEDQRQLQYNLVRSHSAGAGQLFSPELSRAAMLARLNSVMQATSGIHPQALHFRKRRCWR